jgi:hypothetical protein
VKNGVKAKSNDGYIRIAVIDNTWFKHEQKKIVNVRHQPHQQPTMLQP